MGGSNVRQGFHVVSPRFVFVMPLKPKAVSKRWDIVSQNLALTLRSIRNSAHQGYEAFVCGHDRPDVPELNDAQVTFLPVSFDHVEEINLGIADKQRKLRHIGAHLRAQGRDDFYVMFMDADDLIHRDLVAHVLNTDNRRGYLARQGYRYDGSSGRLRLQSHGFDRACGSCFVGWMENADLPEHHEDKRSYFNKFVRHTECYEEAQKKGRTPDDFPFPASLYNMNHDESLNRSRYDGRIREVKVQRAIPHAEAQRILTQGFGVELPLDEIPERTAEEEGFARPEKPVAPDVQKKAARLRKAAGSLKPRMTPAVLVRFDELLDGVRNYLEFGSGGSTAIAAAHPVERIWSVETDLAWVETCMRHDAIRAGVEAGSIKFKHVDVGPTGKWGFPLTRESSDKWPSYYLDIWEDLDPRTLDLVFIDGRWRVQCVLQSLLRVTDECLLALHGVSERRPQYNAVLEFADIVDQTEALLTFRRKPGIDPERVTALLPRFAKQAL